MTAQLQGIEVGTELPELVVGPVTRAALALFAGASGDHNPIHIDIDAAKAAGMPDVIAHGMLSMAYLGRLVTGWVPQTQLRELRARFLAPTPVGARLTCTGKVVSVSDAETERQAKLQLVVVLEDGTVTIRGAAVIGFRDFPEQRSVPHP